MSQFLISGNEVKIIRKKLNLNQLDFWQDIGVTQSAGSRYERGNTNMPSQICELIRIRYIEKLPLEYVKGEYVQVALALQAKDIALYQSLKRIVQNRLLTTHI
jgi:transcriptional regulator with XRE-family HTH domain